MVTCHVGNGGSIAAVVDGKCIDTSMGLTPLEGLMMGTRAGDIDGGAVTFIEKKLGLDADGMSNLPGSGYVFLSHQEVYRCLCSCYGWTRCGRLYGRCR